MDTSIAQAPRRLLAGLLVAALTLTGLVVSASSASAATTDRIAGDNRYETAGDIASRTYPDGVTDVVLATGENFPDALAASGVAGQVDAPVLLTAADALPQETEAALGALDPDTVHIAGGTMAVSQDVEDALDALGYDTPRFDGDDRFETAALIAEAIGAENVANNTAIIATGWNHPDALAGGPLAHAGPHPILLVGEDVPQVTENALTELGITDVIILGETDAVSAEVEAELATITGDTDVTRLGGERRYETAAEIADYAVTNAGFTLSTVLIANGVENFGVDALAGGPHGGVIGAPILLVTEEAVPPGTETFLSDNAADIDLVRALGGTAVIDEDTLTAAAAAATQASQTFEVTLSWINEVTVPTEGEPQYRQGEPEADGSATISLDPESDTIDFSVNYEEVTGPFDAAAGFHIHAGTIDENGPIQVTLATGAELEAEQDQILEGTVTELAGTDAAESLDALIDAILADPDSYYLNLHSNAYPAGAIRGQLPLGGQDQIPAPAEPQLTAPTNLQATAASESSVVLTWDEQEVAGSYTVHRAEAAAADVDFDTDPTAFSPAGTVTATTDDDAVETFTDEGLTPGATYTYVVTAAAGDDVSTASNEAEVTLSGGDTQAPTATDATFVDLNADGDVFGDEVGDRINMALDEVILIADGATVTIDPDGQDVAEPVTLNCGVDVVCIENTATTQMGFEANASTPDLTIAVGLSAITGSTGIADAAGNAVTGYPVLID